MSEYIAKAFIEPRDYRVVFLIQKEHPGDCHLRGVRLSCYWIIISFLPIGIIAYASFLFNIQEKYIHL